MSTQNLEHAATARRVERFLLLVTAAGIAAASWYGGWHMAAGFALGALGSWWNFQGMKAIVATLGTTGSTGRLGAFAWILFRFLVLVAGAFVILRFTPVSLNAAFAGLFVSVGAVVLEAIYDLTYER